MAATTSHTTRSSVNADSRRAEALAACQRTIDAKYPELNQRTALDYCRKYAVLVFKPGNESERHPDSIVWAGSEAQATVEADIQRRMGNATITMFAMLP